MPLILGAQSAVATGFDIDNSCRFDAATGEWMYRTQETPTGTGTKATISLWVKPGKYMATGGYIQIQDFAATSSFSIYENAGDIGFNALNDSGYVARRYTDAKLRDPGAWTHVFALWDTTDAVAADRMQLWVNGVRITSFSLDTDPVQDSTLDCLDNSVVTRQIVASYSYGGGSYFDGNMGEVCFMDGQAYAPTDFGEFDEDSPTIWKPKDPSTLTFGDAGWYLDFGDSASMGADVSGNGNDMTTVTNIAALNQCTDSPTNNFCTLNRLNRDRGYFVYSEGNTKIVTTSYNDTTSGTLGMPGGKWYWEINSIVGPDLIAGVCDNNLQTTTTDQPQNAGSCTALWFCQSDGTDGTYYANCTSSAQSGFGVTTSDILQVAYDGDSGKLWFGINNVWFDSGDPAGGTDEAMTVDTSPTIVPFMAARVNTSRTFGFNFGNPPYALTSAVADANGYGQFEYAPPSGFLALCTKNLGSDGG